MVERRVSPLMATYNKVYYIGNLTRDPDFKITEKNRRAVVHFCIAVNTPYRTSDGEKKQSTIYVECEAWEGLAEAINQNTAKGTSVFVEGSTIQERFEKNGETRVITKVKVKEIQFLTYPRRGPRGSEPQSSEGEVYDGPTDRPF
jgi:single-strand DNA-binding protein